MSEVLRYGELFAGAGGMSLGLHRAGWECAFHAEIDDFARRVLTHRFPGAGLESDVTTLTGADLVAKYGEITLLAGGSPCQDLSQAGNRAGLDGDRSSLFFHQMRLWEETGAEYCLWENVYGALTSNQGADFARVLGAFVGDVVEQPVDAKGRVRKWPSAGVVCGPSGVAAWRVMDAQYWGVGQRRRRVFVLGARTGSVCPGEVLFECEGVSWHPAPRVSPEEEVAAAAEPRAAAGGEADAGRPGAGGRPVRFLTTPGAQLLRPNDVTYLAFDDTFGSNANVFTNQVPTIKAAYDGGSGSSKPAIVGFYAEGGAHNMCVEGASPTLKAPGADGSGSAHAAVLVYNGRNHHVITDNVCQTLLSKTGDGGPSLNMQPVIVTYDARGNGDGLTVNTLVGDHPRRVTDFTPLVIAFDTKQSGEGGTVAPTLRAMNFADSHLNGGGQVGVVRVEADHPVAGGPQVARLLAFGHYTVDGTASTIQSRDYKDVTDIVHVGRPRRLMPVECEQLMAWPAGFTDVPDEKGRPASDSARYRVIGNGVVSNHPHWIGVRLAAAERAYLARTAFADRFDDLFARAKTEERWITFDSGEPTG